jgi:hypothetical protein
MEGFRPAGKSFNTRAETGEFRKAERQHHVVVPSARFKLATDIVELAHLLFGYAAPS